MTEKPNDGMVCVRLLVLPGVGEKLFREGDNELCFGRLRERETCGEVKVVDDERECGV